MVVGARQSFQFFRQKTWFLENNKALSKFLFGVSHYLISLIGMQTVPRGQFPDWNFPDGQFSDRTLPRRTLSRLDISPLRHFPDRTFPWPHVLVRFFFFSNHFLFVLEFTKLWYKAVTWIGMQIVPRLDISPLRHFPDRTFPWPHVSVRFFSFSNHFFFFVCTRIY